MLQNVEDNLLAVIEGDRKKHNYEIVTSDRSKQSIARCTSLNEDSYRVELMVSSIDPFLVLSYVIVLDLAKTAAIISGAGDDSLRSRHPGTEKPLLKKSI